MTEKQFKQYVKRLLVSAKTRSGELITDYNKAEFEMGAYDMDYWNFVNALSGLCNDYEHIS